MAVLDKYLSTVLIMHRPCVPGRTNERHLSFIAVPQ
jgi:hypothetical protein